MLFQKQKEKNYDSNDNSHGTNANELAVVIYHQNLPKVITLLSACASIINNSTVYTYVSCSKLIRFVKICTNDGLATRC